MEVLKKIFPSRPPGLAFVLVGAVAFAVLLSTYMRVWSPEYGITRFLIIGSEFDQRGIAVYRATPKYINPYPTAKWGFDGQHYAEIALDPLLRDPQLKQAIDDPPYRARRILLPWLAWLGGLGRPFWVLNVYAALNPIFWLGYVVMMVMLFRPHGWTGLAGFSAMLLTCGIIESMHGSLTDFPAFVLMTLAVMIGGTAGAGVMALTGLTREVDVLGLAGIFELKPPWWKALKKNVWFGLIAVGPMLLWFAYIAWRLRMHTAMDGGGNLDWPLHAIIRKLGELAAMARRGGIRWSVFYKDYGVHAFLTIVSILTQCVYLLTHRVWGNRLWRMAIIFVPFFLCISYLPWEDHFTVTRHALPITLGFNLILAMRPGRRWLLWFILGNCFVPYGIFHFWFYGRETPHPEVVIMGAPLNKSIGVGYATGWSEPEWNTRKTWRWSIDRSATLVLSNAQPQALEAQLAFDTMSIVPRDFEISAHDTAIWSGRIEHKFQAVHTQAFLLPPGETVVTFKTSLPPVPPGTDDKRELGFMLSDVQLTVALPPPPR